MADFSCWIIDFPFLIVEIDKPVLGNYPRDHKVFCAFLNKKMNVGQLILMFCEKKQRYPVEIGLERNLDIYRKA